jgi:hypothetical protein
MNNYKVGNNYFNSASKKLLEVFYLEERYTPVPNGNY